MSQLHSLWGRNRLDHDPANRGGSENKHWKHGHGQNPAGAGAELPRGHLWDCSDPWGHRMEPDITTAVDKCRQCGIRQPGKHLQQRDEAMNFNVKQRGGQFSGLLKLISGHFCRLSRATSVNLAHRNVDKVDGRGKAVEQSWLAQTRSAALQIQICTQIPSKNSS